MKKDLITKIVNTVCYTMFTYSESVDSVSVDNTIATKYALASQVSNCFRYVDLAKIGYKEDIIIAYTEYDNAVNIWVTQHSEDNKCIGYKYGSCVYTDKKNQIEVTAELMQALYMTLNNCKY